MTLEVVHRHERLAPESGVEFMASISGACVTGLVLGWEPVGDLQELNYCKRKQIIREASDSPRRRFLMLAMMNYLNKRMIYLIT